jgi:MoaA/NifB/PqqE/SkfB family radical SAM enzyme
MLLTNGLLLRRQTADVAAHVDELIVSLDGGTAATYEAIRGVDALNLVLEGIAACKAAGVRVTTRTTVQRLNYKEIPQIADAAMLAGADLISYLAVDTANPFAFGDRQNIADDALTSEQCAELARILDDFAVSHAQAFRAGRIAETPAKLRRILYGHFYSARHGTPYDGPLCNAPHFSTVVEVDGTLRPCYFLPAYGRLTPSESSLKAAINTDAAAALRQAYRSGQREECARCVCPLYKSPRALVNM